MIVKPDCQKPACSKDAEETYTGSNGNRLRLCERHYYNLVSKGARSSGDDSGPLYPFWDSGIRCNGTDTDIELTGADLNIETSTMQDKDRGL